MFTETEYDSTNEAMLAARLDTVPGAHIWRSDPTGRLNPGEWEHVGDIIKPPNAYSVLDFLYVPSAAAAPPSGNVILAGTDYGGSYVYKSWDGGTNWTVMPVLGGEDEVQGLAYDPFRNRVYACTSSSNGRIWYSDNYGDTWTESPATTANGLGGNQSYIYDIEFMPSGYGDTPGVVVAGTGINDSQIWISTDGGINFTLKAAINASQAADVDSVLTICYVPSACEFENCGQSHPSGAGYVGDLLYPSGTGVLLAGTDDYAQVWRSIDAGHTWTRSGSLSGGGSGAKIYDMLYDKHRGWVWATVMSSSWTNPKIYYSRDAGKTWVFDGEIGSVSDGTYWARGLGHSLKYDRLYVAYGKVSSSAQAEVWKKSFLPSGGEWWREGVSSVSSSSFSFSVSSSSSSVSSSSESSSSSSTSSSSESSSSSSTSSSSSSSTSSSSSSQVALQTLVIPASASDARIYNSAGAPWSTVRNAATGVGVDATYSSQTQYYITAGYTTSPTPPYYAYAVYRNFYDFDLSLIPSAGGVRQLQSATVMLGGISYQDSSVILQAASGANSALTVADYNNFTGSPLCSAQDWNSDGGYGLPNYLQMNSIGLNYVASKMVSGSWIRFAAREYDHDYLNVDPQGGGGATQWFKNGGYYANTIGGGDVNTAQIMWAPKLVVTYIKSTGWVWRSRMGPSYWTITQGSWDGSKYSAAGSFPNPHYLKLAATGTWATSASNAESLSNIIRITFDTAPSIDVDFRNTDGDEQIADVTQRIGYTSGTRMTVWNYNNYNFAFDTLEMETPFAGSDFNVTNIEFLAP